MELKIKSEEKKSSKKLKGPSFFVIWRRKDRFHAVCVNDVPPVPGFNKEVLKSVNQGKMRHNNDRQTA